MLYDTLENLNQYTGLFEHLDTAIDFIEGGGLGALPAGRTDIDGDAVYVTVTEAETTPGEGRPFETHSRYMDLHIDLAGVELCETALGEGRFAVFLAEEAHKPLIRAQGSNRVKKAVFKIAY